MENYNDTLIKEFGDNNYSPNPKDHNATLETWQEFFDFQASKDGANYSMLKEWLIKYCEVPKLKEEE